MCTPIKLSRSRGQRAKPLSWATRGDLSDVQDKADLLELSPMLPLCIVRAVLALYQQRRKCRERCASVCASDTHKTMLKHSISSGGRE